MTGSALTLGGHGLVTSRERPVVVQRGRDRAAQRRPSCRLGSQNQLRRKVRILGHWSAIASGSDRPVVPLSP